MTDPDRRSTLFDSYTNAAIIVSGIDAEQLGDATPCPKYDVAGLIDHLVEAGHRAAALGRGQAPPPGDKSPHVELSDAPGQVRRTAEEAEQAWRDESRLSSRFTMPSAEDFVENAAAPFAPAIPGRVNGPAAMRGAVAWPAAQFPDIRMELESLVAEDDIVVARVISRGTNLGQVDGGPPATGKTFAASQSHWFRVADGKLCEHWATRDDLSAMLQLGVIQPPGPPPGAR